MMSVLSGPPSSRTLNLSSGTSNLLFLFRAKGEAKCSKLYIKYLFLILAPHAAHSMVLDCYIQSKQHTKWLPTCTVTNLSTCLTWWLPTNFRVLSLSITFRKRWKKMNQTIVFFSLLQVLYSIHCVLSLCVLALDAREFWVYFSVHLTYTFIVSGGF